MTRALWAIAVVAAIGVYGWRLDGAAGLTVDDAWYVLLAKSLARGDGFRLISSATDPILPAFPPGFPAILALVFRMQPEFPGNLFLLKSVSVVAMFGVGVLTYLHLARGQVASRMLAAAVAITTVLTPAFVFLATSTVMAECVFTVLQLGAVVVLDGAGRTQGSARSRWSVAIAAVIAAATVLVRTAGLALVLAGTLYLLQQRRWRAAVAFTATVAVCLLPWLLYVSEHRPTPAQSAAHGGSVAYGYGQLLAMRYGGDAGAGRIGVADLPRRVQGNLVNVFGRDIGAIIFPAAFRGPAESGEEVVSIGGGSGNRGGSMGGATATVILSAALSAIALAGFLSAFARERLTLPLILVTVTIAMIVLVPAHTFRYLLPLTPFVLAYFLSGIGVIASLIRRPGSSLMGSELRIAALCLPLMLGIEHAQYIWQARNGPPPDWLGNHQEVTGMMGWMNRNLVSEGAVTTNNPGLVYLLTGRKTLAWEDPRANWDRWRALGVRYAVALHPAEKPSSDLGYRLLYESPGRRLWVLELPRP